MLCQLGQSHELFMNTHTVFRSTSLLILKVYYYIYVEEALICVVVHADHFTLSVSSMKMNIPNPFHIRVSKVCWLCQVLCLRVDITYTNGYYSL